MEQASYYMKVPQELHTRAKLYVASFPQSAGMNMKRLYVEALEYYLNLAEGKNMSHEIAVKTSISNIDAVQQACERLGWELKEGGNVRYFSGKGQVCDYTVEMCAESRLSRYNLGLRWDASTQTYEVLCDNSMNGPMVREGLGGETPRVLGLFTQQYNMVFFAMQAEAQGLQVEWAHGESGIKVAQVHACS